MELRFFFSAHRLMRVYICIKFHENVLDSIKVWCGHNFHMTNFKGALSREKYRWSYVFFLCNCPIVIYICGVTTVLFSALCLMVVYICTKFH